MIIKEFRVVLPMTVDEYQVAQLYSVAEASKNETGGGEGIEVVTNEPFSSDPNEKLQGEQPKTPLLNGSFTSGQYTYKIYHLASKVPMFIRLLAPKGSLEIQERAWNAYPYCRTVIKNDSYMKENFYIKIESLHLPDRGDSENAHQLHKDLLEKRTTVMIDIAKDEIKTCDYKESEDPLKYTSVKTGRGPLKGPWKDSVTPVMCCYKLVTVLFKWWGLQGKVESFIQKTERRLFTNFHRQVFCWTDLWYGLTMKDIRELEDQTKADLDMQRKSSLVRGTVGKDDD